ncbi:hypothetical protein PVAP13_9NG852900 [Panicum virgatum]|uniref:Uncharacterized protein n=1 Tax=Panicum virgatum TaxID=38727 RepID=A0A8T0N0J1_PANVG|nr:hypothetical protein PVAP13_9NG852900 [Panicum virgatum]
MIGYSDTTLELDHADTVGSGAHGRSGHRERMWMWIHPVHNSQKRPPSYPPGRILYRLVEGARAPTDPMLDSPRIRGSPCPVHPCQVACFCVHC